MYENWVAVANGGTGVLPEEEPASAYVKCVSCHGWDMLGQSGGAAHWIRRALQPNSGLGDSNTVSRSISIGNFGNYSSITKEQVMGIGGRSWAEGSEIWDGSSISASLGNTHPDYSQNASFSNQQLNDLLVFLNAATAQPDQVFKSIDSSQTPVAYTLREDASIERGESYYATVCVICHGDPNSDSTVYSDFLPGEGGLLAFLEEDGAPSEFMHRVRWGKPGTTMTRFAMGNPTALEVADMLMYLNSLRNPSGNTVILADAGSNQFAAIDSIVYLDSANSLYTNNSNLSIQWQLEESPAESQAILINYNSAVSSLVVDQVGEYLVTLVIDNGVNSDSDSITISAFDADMVARGENLWDVTYDCDSCHGEDVSLELIPTPNSIVAGFLQRSEDMSSLGNLTEEEMTDLRAYLATIQ